MAASAWRFSFCCAREGCRRRTLQRWRRWWQTTFLATAFWRAQQGLFMPPVRRETLPASLLERFRGPDARGPLLGLLRFLGPLTPGSHLGSRLAMANGDPQRMAHWNPSQLEYARRGPPKQRQRPFWDASGLTAFRRKRPLPHMLAT